MSARPLPPGRVRAVDPAHVEARVRAEHSRRRLVERLADELEAPSAGQDTERLRDEIARSVFQGEPDRLSYDIADALLDGPLRQLIAERDEARATVQRVRYVHASDGAETPFCGECGHTYPCLTIRALDGDT